MRSPVHNEELPSKLRSLKGVRIDGHPVTFIDETVPDNLHRTLVETKTLRSRGALVDCVTFVALMNSIELGRPDDSGHFAFREKIDEVEIDPEDVTNDLPVALGYRGDRTGGAIAYRHSAQPSHVADGGEYLATGAFYLQKLGDNGPVCLSPLTTAMTMYRSNVVHPTPELWCE